MSLFAPKTFNDIMAGMLTRLLASTPLTDVNFGSVWSSLLEAAASEDDEQYFQMTEIIRGYSLDTTFGTDLDDRAFEYGLTRRVASKASTVVTLGDSAITKVVTDIYGGLPGAPAGNQVVYGNSRTGFPDTGAVIIGRGTSNAETVTYSSISVFPNYVRFNLAVALIRDHGTDETIILSQGGVRLVPAGTVALVPASDLSNEIRFTTDANATIEDGEKDVTDIVCTATAAGSDANVPIGAIAQFDSLPFPSATVKNPYRVTNGIDVESDQELRDRIKSTIQSLSRGTKKSITTGVLNVSSDSDNKRVVSVSVREPTVPADVVKLFIDDGTGFIPTVAHVGKEIVVDLATGGEKYINTSNFPVVKASVETAESQPFAILNGQTLFVEVSGKSEVITFVDSDFATPGAALAQEIIQKINRLAVLFEARVSSGGERARLFSRSTNEEEIRVTGGTANTALKFPTDQKQTARLYRLRGETIKLLSKDGKTALLESGGTASYNISSLVHLSLVIDGKVKNVAKVWFDPAKFSSPGSVQAQEVVDVLAAACPGLDAEVSSSNTRFSLSSKTKRSAASKIRIVSDFTTVLNEESGILIDRTVSFKSASSDVQMFASVGDYVYLGHADIPFDSIFVKLVTPASTDLLPTFEYSKGLTFAMLGVNDETNGFTQDGHILFAAPSGWVKSTVEGVTAYWIRIARTAVTVTTPPTEDRVRICGANEIFQFSEVEDVGEANDYSINRYLGQIELVETLQAGDSITAGTEKTRAFVLATAIGPYVGLPGTTLQIVVDGVTRSITFQNSDFLFPALATAREVAAAITSRLGGVTGLTTYDNTSPIVRSNRHGSGTLQVLDTGANSILIFPTDIASSMTSHVASLESATQEPWVFAADDSLFLIVDDNFAGAFTVPLFKQGAMTSVTSTSVFADSTLSTVFTTDDEIAGYDLVIKTGPQAGQRRSILSYVKSTGTITLATPLSGLPVSPNAFQIIPVSVSQLVAFWSNKQITLLSNSVEISGTDAGRRIQLATNTLGEEGSVEVSGGSANSILAFPSKNTGVDGYKYFTGLAQRVQWIVDGRDDDQTNYPGIRAAGVQVEVIEPVTIPVRVDLLVTAREGISVGSITNNIKSSISNYINRLNVGDDVILSELIVAVKKVDGVFDASLRYPPANIPIADNELARISDDNIVIS